MSKKNFKTACWFTLVAGVSIALWRLVMSAILPPRTLTEGAIGVMNRRILLYANRYDRLPAAISELSEANGYYNSDEDGVILRVPNPYAKGKEILLMAGIRSLGLRSAILAFITQFDEIKKGNSKDSKIIAKIVTGVDKSGDGRIDTVRVLE